MSVPTLEDALGMLTTAQAAEELPAPPPVRDSDVDRAYRDGKDEAIKQVPHARAIQAPLDASVRVRLAIKVDETEKQLATARHNVAEQARTLLEAQKHEARLRAFRDRYVELMKRELP